MRIWDKELLTAQKKSPVTNGLTFWIDGQDAVLNNENGTFMLDRTDDTYVNANPISCIITNSGKSYVVNKNYINGSMSISAKTSYQNTKTFEVVSYNNIKQQASIWLGGTSVSVSTSCFPGYVQNNLAILKTTVYGNSMYGAALSYPEAQTEMFDFILRFNDNGTFDVFINGQNILHETGSKWSSSPALMFAIVGSPSSITNIGAYRTYDRALTNKEILQNYNYEKSLGRVS